MMMMIMMDILFTTYFGMDSRSSRKGSFESRVYWLKGEGRERGREITGVSEYSKKLSTSSKISVT